jgi:hypothetical protein
MVVKMLKKILTRKKSPVSKRKYTKKNTKKVKKVSKKVGGMKGGAITLNSVNVDFQNPNLRYDQNMTDAKGNTLTEDRFKEIFNKVQLKVQSNASRNARSSRSAASRSAAPAAAAAAAAAPAPTPTLTPAEAAKKIANAYRETKSLRVQNPEEYRKLEAAKREKRLRERDVAAAAASAAASTPEALEEAAELAEKKAEIRKRISDAESTNSKIDSNSVSELTNKEKEKPSIAKLESNVKDDGPLPTMVKVYKKRPIRPSDDTEYFNLDNYSLSVLIAHWYGSKKAGLRKFFSFFGGDKPPVPIKDWDVSQVTDMSNLFAETPDFMEDISSWNVSNVQDMSGMFKNTRLFNKNINEWDVGNVRNMKEMFEGAKAFNMYLDQWNTGRVTDMSRMFANSKKFNRVIDTWNVSSVTNMEFMFVNTSYNKPLSSWNVVNVVNMRAMFKNAVKFNQPLGQWGDKIKNIKNVDGMFESAREFRQDLSDWNLSKIGVPISMFEGTRMPNDFNPIGQKVNIQLQNLGLTPAEEEKRRKEQDQLRLKNQMMELKEAQEKAEISYKRILQEKDDERREFYESQDAMVKAAQKKKEKELQNKELEDLEDKKNIDKIQAELRSLMNDSKKDNIKGLKSFANIEADRGGRSAPRNTENPAAAAAAAPGVPKIDGQKAIDWIKNQQGHNTYTGNKNNINDIKKYILTEVKKQQEYSEDNWKNFHNNNKTLDFWKTGNINPKKPKNRR